MNSIEDIKRMFECMFKRQFRLNNSDLCIGDDYPWKTKSIYHVIPVDELEFILDIDDMIETTIESMVVAFQEKHKYCKFDEYAPDSPVAFTQIIDGQLSLVIGGVVHLFKDDWDAI